MHLKYENFSFTEEEKGFTKFYVNDVRAGLLEYAVVFSELLTQNMGVELDLRINEDLLDQVIIDAVEDLKRLVDFHPTKKPNTIKEVAYIAFWWLKRKPLIINNSISKLEIDPNKKAKLIFVNERFLLPYIEQRIFDFNKDIVCKSPSIAEFEAQWEKARKFMLYFLQYRADSAKSIEAFLITSTLHPVRALTDNFWS
ncbi:MAG: hypothetical protein LBC85_05965 [Fibromonadaceae bacterium]|jgi:hypothetical protein|nr:hypothetical protein [Fibromonadaceae bacterium]